MKQKNGPMGAMKTKRSDGCKTEVEQQKTGDVEGIAAAVLLLMMNNRTEPGHDDAEAVLVNDCCVTETWEGHEVKDEVEDVVPPPGGEGGSEVRVPWETGTVRRQESGNGLRDAEG
jgi:hypothetical protein